MSDPEQTAADLIASGYRATSNRYRIISRIDRPDWREAMGRRHTDGYPGDQEENFREGMRWVDCLGRSAGDHYRCVLTQDKIRDVPEAVFKIVRGASKYGSGNLNEYLPLVCS